VKRVAIVLAAAIALPGCFIVGKTKTSSQSSASEPKNHGQARSEEVHERNAERKAEHDAEKADKKK
jgi:hypothetical protein